MSIITSNLQRWINKLESLRDAVWQTAFVNVINEQGISFKDILWREAQTAITSTKEYDIPEFREPLRTAIYMDGCINIRTYDDGRTISVEIDLNKTAGSIENYAQAIRAVRNLMTGDERGWREDKGRASWFWKNFIYRQAREGLKIKKGKLKGQRRRASLSQREGTQMYKETISNRLAAMGTLAPFWELIDKGNINNAALDEGGTPYPSNSATNFVSRAQIEIRSSFEGSYRQKVTELVSQLETQEYGASGLLDQIVDVITMVRERGETWTPGEILRGLEIGNREYQLYITGTSRLGMMLTRYF